MGKATVVLCLLLCSCAPLPNSRFYEGITEETPLEDIEIIKHVGWAETTKMCNKLLPPHQVLLNCILNACIVMGCTTTYWDAEGRVYKCEYWVAMEGGYLEEHELQHCKGYRDTLY